MYFSTLLYCKQEVTETDSEITITAPPPSNLDDISRINTPNSILSNPRGLISREISSLSNAPRVDTVPEGIEGWSKEEPWATGQGQFVHREVIGEEGESQLTTRTADDSYIDPALAVQYSNEPAQFTQGGAPPEIELDEADDSGPMSVAPPGTSGVGMSRPEPIGAEADYSALQPAINATGSGGLQTTKPMESSADDNLDRFDVTDQTLKDELEKELEKL